MTNRDLWTNSECVSTYLRNRRPFSVLEFQLQSHTCQSRQCEVALLSRRAFDTLQALDSMGGCLLPLSLRQTLDVSRDWLNRVMIDLVEGIW